jgi:glycosyltransferase involved in cell wall biosynthesis
MPTSKPTWQPKVAGAAWGDPLAEGTYRGVPCRTYAYLQQTGALVGASNVRLVKPLDYLRGGFHLRRVMRGRGGHFNPTWRFKTENVARLSERYALLEAMLPEHDALLQFGVASLPSRDVALVTHIEMSVATAAADPHFADSYGFTQVSQGSLKQAISGERAFLQRCDLVWTNTPWTADRLIAQGMPAERVRACPPASGMADPGPITKDWETCHILFVGEDWRRKGGPLLLEAFRKLRTVRPTARLTVVGCRPQLAVEGVEVLGRLRKNVPAEATRLDQAYRAATIFCLPTFFDTTGIVFMEAALYSTPIVMVAGQGREVIFPSCMAHAIETPDADMLADTLISLARNPDEMAAMAEAGRRLVLANHTWEKTGAKVAEMVAWACENRR